LNGFLEGEESDLMILLFLQLQRSANSKSLRGLICERRITSHAELLAAFGVSTDFGAMVMLPAHISHWSALQQWLVDWSGCNASDRVNQTGMRDRRLVFVGRLDWRFRCLHCCCVQRSCEKWTFLIDAFATSPVCPARVSTVVGGDGAGARDVCRHVMQQCERCANIRRLVRVLCSEAERLAGYKLLVALRHALLAVHLRCVVEESRLLLSGVLHVARSMKECPSVRKQDSTDIDLRSRLDKRKIEQLISRVRKKDYFIHKSLCGWEWRPWLIDVRSRAKSLSRTLPQLQIAPPTGGVMRIATPRTGVATSIAQAATTAAGVAYLLPVESLLRRRAIAATLTARDSRAELLSPTTISTSVRVPVLLTDATPRESAASSLSAGFARSDKRATGRRHRTSGSRR
jgi:hypothetical protein